jgi:hypothetical protein
MINLGDAHYRGKVCTFWLGPTDGAVYTGPRGETYWLRRTWPTVVSCRHWAMATGNRALVTALDQACQGH